MTQPEKPKHEPSEAYLEEQAGVLTKDIAALDAEMKTLATERAAKHKDLRGITSKLVTLKLKAK